MESSETTQAEHIKGQLSSPSGDLGTGIFSKLVFFGLIVGVVAIYLKTRKGGNGNAMYEKSLA